MKSLDKNYWENRYAQDDAIWDIGYISTPLKNYIDQLENKQLKILIPGGGNGYEAAYLFQHGFRDVYLLDIATSPLEKFSLRNPGFPKDHLLNQDFFAHQSAYDLILEQTFFCALDPSLRGDYVKKMYELLKENGQLAGLLFDDPMVPVEGPPFGGNKNEYTDLFSPFFHIKTLAPCINSIERRSGRELFLILQKKTEPIESSVFSK